MWHTCDHRQGEAPHTHLVSPGWPIFSRWLAVHPLTSPTWPKCCSPVSWLWFVVMHCNTIKMKIYEISTFTFDPFRPNQLEKLEAAKVSDLLLPLVTFSYLWLLLITYLTFPYLFLPFLSLPSLTFSYLSSPFLTFPYHFLHLGTDGLTYYDLIGNWAKNRRRKIPQTCDLHFQN